MLGITSTLLVPTSGRGLDTSYLQQVKLCACPTDYSFDFRHILPTKSRDYRHIKPTTGREYVHILPTPGLIIDASILLQVGIIETSYVQQV